MAAVATQVKLAVQEQRSLREESVTLQRKASLPGSSLMPPERPTDEPTDKPARHEASHEHDVAGTSSGAVRKGSSSGFSFRGFRGSAPRAAAEPADRRGKDTAASQAAS